MASDEIRRNLALFSIGTVMKLTDLSARQIRYYEQHELIQPARTSGKQRLFSFNDVEKLLEIKSLIEKGVNIAGIKQVIGPGSGMATEPNIVGEPSVMKRRDMTEPQVHRLLKQQLKLGTQRGQVSLIQGELFRFYKQ